MFKDQRGQGVSKIKKELRKTNVARVEKWLAKNPDGTATQCAKDLGLARNTIYSISRELSGK